MHETAMRLLCSNNGKTVLGKTPESRTDYCRKEKATEDSFQPPETYRG